MNHRSIRNIRSIPIVVLATTMLALSPSANASTYDVCYEAELEGVDILLEFAFESLSVMSLNVFFDGSLFHESDGAAGLAGPHLTERADGSGKTHSWWGLWAALLEGPGAEFTAVCTSGCTGVFDGTLGDEVPCP